MRLKRLAAGALAAVMLAGYAITPELKDAFVISAAAAEGDVAINAANFPDAKFREYLSANFDTDNNNVLSQAERDAVTFISVNGSDEERGTITSLKGIENFKYLRNLSCFLNQITTLDVSKNTLLIYINCDGNQLTSLDVSKNTELTELMCGRNQIKTLDVSNNTALVLLHCFSNQLTTLDVSKNTKLEFLACDNNSLTSIDLSKNTALNYFSFNDTQMSSLDISKNTKLEELWCSNTLLTSIDVSKNVALKLIYCSENRLTSLDVSKNTALERLYCSENKLTALNVRNNPALTELVCGSNQITALDISNNPAITVLGCNENQLTSLNISRNTALKEIWCYGNQITSLDTSKNTALEYISCSDNRLTSLDIGNKPVLTELWCNNNQITRLDLSKCDALKTFSCADNQLTSLDVSNNFLLTELYTDKNITIYGISGSYAETYANKNSIRFVATRSAVKIKAFVERLYTKLLKRSSDPNGLADWTSKLMNGSTAAEVAYGFLFSDEILKSGISNKEFVTRMYETFLGRSPDAAGLADWVSALDNGCTIGLIFNGFVQSQEFGKLCDDAGIKAGSYKVTETRDMNRSLTAFVSRMYTKALNRSYDPAGLNDWTNRYLNQGAKVEDIAYGFIFSQEFIGKNLSDADYIETLYKTFFNRPSDEAGKKDWLDRMQNKGYSRRDVLNGFVGSQECIDLVKSFGI